MAPRQLTGDEEAVLDALCEWPRDTIAGIATRTGLSAEAVEKALRHLYGRSCCRKSGNDRGPDAAWVITDRGRKLAVAPNPAVWQEEAWTG